MKRPLPLTTAQKSRVGKLEPRLRQAARRGDLKTAKQIATELQSILRPTGHHMRLFWSKNWLFEAALEAGEIKLAIQGFEGIRKAVSPKTRIYIEATSLLAVCYLRNGDIETAKPFMAEVLADVDVIKSDFQRRQFKRRVIDRFDEEAVLTSLRNCGSESLDPAEIEAEAGLLVQTQTEDEMFRFLGENTPQHTVDVLLRIDEYALKQLPDRDVKYLPGARVHTERREVGRVVFGSFKRVLWRSLCDHDSDIYKVWFNSGMGAVLNKAYLGAAIGLAFSGSGIGMKALAISTLALLIKFGLEVFCENYKPEALMEAREERARSKKKK